MKVKLQDIIDALEWDVDSAVVDDFYTKAEYKEPTEEHSVSNITDKLGFIDTNKAEFQLFLRDFMEMYNNDYQSDLIKNVLEPYYDHSYDLEEEFFDVSDEVKQDSINKGLYSEELEEDYSRPQNTLIDTGLSDRKAEEVLLSVIGQLSDGIWENSRGMEKYWQYADIIKKGSEIYISVNTENYESGYRGKSEQDIKRYFAQKVKQIVKEEGLEWSRDNTEISAYLDRGSDVTVQDAYRVYDKLLGRVDRLKTEESKEINSLLEWNLIDNDPITYHAEQNGWYFNIYKLEDAQKPYNLIVDYQYNELQDLDDLFDSLEDAKHRAQEIFNKGIQDNKSDGDYAQFEYEINKNKEIKTESEAVDYDYIMNKRHLQESINFDGFKNNEELQKYFQELGNLPDELTLDNKEYYMEQYGTLTNGNNYVVYTDKNNNDSYIKVYYTLKQVDDNKQEGIKTIIGVTDLREED